MLPSFPLITAHRGASHDAPENTLAALRLGFAQGADAGECDVRVTADGHAILLHDSETGRVAGRKLVAAHEALASLQSLDVGSWKGSAWGGEKIPTLEQAFGVVPSGRRLLIEIKCGAEILPALERAFTAATAAQLPAAFILMSFDLAVAAAAKRRFPEIETHWIVERDGTPPGRLAATARGAGLDGVNLDRRFPIDGAFVSELHAARLRVHVWTVDEAALARRLAAAGVDSITTNRPGRLREQLGL